MSVLEFFFFFFFCFLLVGVDTMKLNKSKLKQLAQSGEVAVAPVSLKRKKPNEGSSRRAEEPSTRHTVRDAMPVVQTVPHVVMVDVDTAPPSNLLASRF